MTLPFPNTTYHHRHRHRYYTSSCIFKFHSPPIHSSLLALSCRPRMDYTTTTCRQRRNRDKEKERVVVIMGATGAGKSRLSIELATRFFPSSEIINSDKMQIYKGLDITTNKIPFHDRLGVPHHLLGEIDSSDTEFSPSYFRLLGSSIITDITSRRKIPFVVGGSNSFIHALVAEKFDPDSDVFDGSHSVCSSELRYNCCFLWIDISLGVLPEYLSMRVEEMLDSGMFHELSEFYNPDDGDSVPCRTGIRKAIGVPEFDKYLKKYPPERRRRRRRRRITSGVTNPEGGDVARRECYGEAVRAIKDNTCQLAKGQIRKILRLKAAGWDLKRLDATEAFRAVIKSDSGEMVSEYWEKQVLEPSVKIVKQFLEGHDTSELLNFST